MDWIEFSNTVMTTQTSALIAPPTANPSALIRPRSLNLQAIDTCNSRCVMCNIWKDGRREKMTLDELRQHLAHPFFSKVMHVGVTGGEPTLRKDLVELYRLLPECLPSLAGASFITHGMQTKRAIQFYTEVHEHYRRLNLAFDGMVSLDGVGATHDLVRGRKGAFDSATQTLLELKERGVSVIAACTIVRSNVYGLHDLLDWGKANGVYVRFRVAEFIRRLYNDSCGAEIRRFDQRELRHLVSFFHLLLTEYETNETIQKTYRSILSLLTGGERLIGCPYQKGLAVNVDSIGSLACCAPKGSAFEMASDVGEVHSTLEAQRAEVAQAHCANCIHDYHDDWNETALLEVTQARDRSPELYDVPDVTLTTLEVKAQPLELASLKQLLLAGWYGTETAGDIAILQGIITEYLQVNPQLQFQVLSLYPYYTRTTIAAWPEELRARVRIIDYASEEAWQATLDCDALVMAGGPLMDIHETRKILCLFKHFADLEKPRVIEGCGVGPLNRMEFRWNVCRIARLATRISVRDRASREALRYMGIRKDISVRSDPATTFIRAQGIRHHGSETKVIRCFLRELTSEYPQSLTPDQAAANLTTFLRRLLDWYPEHRIELWAMHHFSVGFDDRLFARQLARQIANPRLTCDWEPRSPREILQAMAAAEFCVCMRFHSCVFAAEIGAPFLAIDYTAGGKIKGFLDDIRQDPRLCGLADLASLENNRFEAKVRNLPATELLTEVSAVATAPRILHIIQSITGGGGARAMIALAKHSRRLGSFEHRAVSLLPGDAMGLKLAEQAGLPILNSPGHSELRRAIADADLVLVHWWNNPELAALFRRELPPMRLALWLHVGGYHSPQVLTRPLIDFADLAVACSPHTYAHPVFTNLPEATRAQRTAMVLAGADFDRLQDLTPRVHEGFQVGYIGTIDPVKMHSDFVAMSCAVRVPDAKLVVCGGGDSRWLAAQAETLGRSASFDFKGHVEDIRGVLETLDVYGYPLCADTYAAAELNLQEVMFAGVPVVAFPHGGIGQLIRHGETGLLVETPEAYARAIEHLYQNPSERARLGANAAAFARNFWGAENAAREFNVHFERLLAQPKRERQWGVPPGGSLSELPDSAIDLVPELALHSGARMLVESLADGAQPFLDSLTSARLEDILAAEERIAGLSRLMHFTGVLSYRNAHSKDPLLQLWAGLGFLHSGHADDALGAFALAQQHGFTHWRIHWYRAVAAELAGKFTDAVSKLNLVVESAPDFAPARDMLVELGFVKPPADFPRSPALPKAARGCVQQAERFLQQGDLANARDWLERALDLSPNQPDLMESLCELDCQLGNLDVARRTYEAILQLDPQPRTPGRETIQVALGLCSADADPLVTVLISTYASEKYLRACLEDLQAQTIAHKIEIIIIDSGSPENERAIVEEFQKRYSNIRYIRTERETLYAAWNRGVEMARGQYITNANADDSHRADALELLVAALEANPKADLSYGDYFTTLVPNDTFAAPTPLRLNQHPPYHPAILHFYCVTGCHPMWRRTVFDKIGLFDPQYTAPGDYEFLLRFAAHGLRAVHVPQPLSLFYQNQEGLSFKSRERSEREFKAIQTKYRAEIPIERLFRVDPTAATSVARGWTALGNLAMSYEAPWFDNACQDFPFALHCYQTALRHDSDNTVARFNLVMTTALHDPAKLGRILSQLPSEELRRAKNAIATGRFDLIAVDVPPAVGPLEYGRGGADILSAGSGGILAVVNTGQGCALNRQAGSPTHEVASHAVISPVRFLGSLFDFSEAASAARTLVPKLASKMTLGTLDRAAYSEVIGASMPAAEREVLRNCFRRYPFLRGGVTISHGAAIDFQVPSDTSLRVGWTSCPFPRVPERWVMACQQMDEVWVPSASQLEAFVASGVPRTRLAVMPTPVDDSGFGHSPEHVAELVVARLQQLERGMTSIQLPDHRAETISTNAPVTISWEGTFRDLGSLSHVNREVTRQLATQTNVGLSCGSSDEPSRGKSTADITVRHEWPPRWQRPASGAWVLIQPWEFGALPAEWVRELKNVDEVWAPSEYVRRVYLDSGVPAGKVRVMPNGIDPERFHPNVAPLNLPTRKQFKFLFVGGTIQRKGPDVLLETFLARFTAEDEVCLVIKDFGGQGIYAGQTIAEQIRAAQQKPGAPEIIYLTDDLSSEEVAGLYAACDCLVHPYRGEGFALPVLEAMACGLPVIVTAGGATDDFATDEWAYRITALRKPVIGSVAGLPLAGRGWWLEPDAEALGEQMRWVTAHRGAARAKGRAASDYVRREWIWAKSAAIAAQLARDLKSRRSRNDSVENGERDRPGRAGRRPADRLCAHDHFTNAASSLQQDDFGGTPKTAGETPALPNPVAKRGELIHAQELLRNGSHLEAWTETLSALRVRPFHPGAWLLLAEIALAAGDGAQARRCAERARALAPQWKPAKQFLSRPLKGKTPMAWPELPAVSSPPRLSVCLITKNEERFLGRCLESVRGIADQIVIVDTGSTDRTIEIACEHGAEVHEFTWCDDFSAARNAALAYATGDWVLSLDADEELSPDSAEKLRRDIQNSAVMAYRLPIVDVDREEEGCHYIPRLFRNAPGLYFAGRIHEQLFPSLEPLRRELALENKLGTATLLHHGYTGEVTKSRSKVERNLRLLRLAIAETPGDANLLLNLGLELTRAEQSHAGLEAYDQAWLALSAQPVEAVPAELRETLLMQYLTHLMGAGCWQQLLGLFETSQGRAADGNASLHFLRGMAAMKLNRWKHAVEQMRRCLARRDQPSLTTIHADIRTVAPHHCLALSLTQTKDFEGAAKAFADALQEAPNNFAVQFDYAGFLFARGRDVDALQQLHQLAELKPEEVTVWQSGGKVALSRPDFLEVALDWTDAAHRQFPTDTIVAVQRAEALLLSGRAAEALSLWREFHDPVDPRQTAACLLCEIITGRSGPKVPLAAQAGTAHEVLLWFQRFIPYGAEEVIRNLLANLAVLRERCPAAAEQLEIIFAQAGTEAVAA